MGPFVFINYFITRDDGTFTMPLTDPSGTSPPAGSGYYLRVRLENDSVEKPKSWNTPSFTLDPATAERDVVVTIPRAVEAK